jgi:hypothetical protein
MGDDMKNVLLGALQWKVPRWQDEYYPEDLPEEWQLSYYANEFSTTLIDVQQYLDEDSFDELAEALDGCQDLFHPVICVSTDSVAMSQAEEFIRSLAALDPDTGIQRLAGVCLHDIQNIEDRILWEEWRTVIPSGLPVAIDHPPPDQAGTGEWFGQHGMNFIWKPQYGYDAAGEDAYHWLAYLDLHRSPRDLARDISYFLGTVPQDAGAACLIAEQGYEVIDKLHELSTLLSLING